MFATPNSVGIQVNLCHSVRTDITATYEYLKFLSQKKEHSVINDLMHLDCDYGAFSMEAMVCPSKRLERMDHTPKFRKIGYI